MWIDKMLNNFPFIITRRRERRAYPETRGRVGYRSWRRTRGRLQRLFVTSVARREFLANGARWILFFLFFLYFVTDWFLTEDCPQAQAKCQVGGPRPAPEKHLQEEGSLVERDPASGCGCDSHGMEEVGEEQTLVRSWRGSGLLWRSRPGSCGRCGRPTLPWSQSCGSCDKGWSTHSNASSGPQTASRKVNRRMGMNTEFWKRRGKGRRPVLHSVQHCTRTPIHTSPWPELILRSPPTYSIHPQTLVLFSELCMPDPAWPSLFHALSQLPWPRLRNSVLDLLIPLLRSRPCIVPCSYKSEPPMYCRPSSNIN